jgi:hypothetical protein
LYYHFLFFLPFSYIKIFSVRLNIKKIVSTPIFFPKIGKLIETFLNFRVEAMKMSVVRLVARVLSLFGRSELKALVAEL